jgi:hypothetical protein
MISTLGGEAYRACACDHYAPRVQVHFGSIKSKLYLGHPRPTTNHYQDAPGLAQEDQLLRFSTWFPSFG